MSYINIAFGTRKGGGEELKDTTPFTPDTLCEECASILGKNLDRKNTRSIDPTEPTECRVCQLLISRLTEPSRGNEPFEVCYRMEPRFGYFIRVHNVVFFRPNSNTLVRLGLQMARLEKHADHPSMVQFRPDLAPCTDSQCTMRQIREWYDDCINKHEECRKSFPKKQFVPSRLIEIMGSEESGLTIRLRRRGSLPPELEYATLSHRWGATMPYRLTLDLLDSSLEKVPLSKLSRVFVDAVTVASRLGIRYIWIDSLCIIQDSIEDWNAESAQMGAIYQHATLNIAATGFADGNNGLFVQRDQKLLPPISFSLEADQIHKSNRQDYKPGNYYLVDTGVWADGVDESPLCQRGWVTQERSLSARTIHFGKDQVFWECHCTNACEVFPTDLLRGTKIQDPKVFLASSAAAKQRRIAELEGIRKRIESDRELDEHRRSAMRAINDRSRAFRKKWGMDISDPDDSDEAEEATDEDFAMQMQALRTNNKKQPQQRAQHSMSDESDSSASQYDWDAKPPRKLKGKKKPSQHSVRKLSLAPRHFEDCDLSILDGLGIRGWKNFKARLQSWGFGPGSEHVAVLPVRGMPLCLKQWITTVQFFSRCDLTLSKDKLIAVSGMAQSLAPDMRCEYLAGLWRKDLEHQLLWKCIRPRPAPVQDGTRGPSWTWAAIDGEVEIPSWSGYFYAHPGDVTWYTNVDDAAVRLADTGSFGQVKPGIVTLTGRLGVFRIDRDKTENAAPRSANDTFDPTKRWIWASWDATDIMATFGKSGNRDVWRYTTYGTSTKASPHVLDVFYMPFRVMEADPDEHDYERPMLTGLLLLPVGNGRRGVFRRVGQYEMSEFWERREKEGQGLIEVLSESTSIVDSRFFVARRKERRYTVCVV